MEKLKLTVERKVEMRVLTPVKAIRAKCIDCCAGQVAEVRKCVMPDCPIFPFRLGKNPNRSGIGRKLSVVSGKTLVQADINMIKS